MELKKISKSILNKIIKWTSSRFNVYSKSEVIDIILNMKDGETKTFTCGSYGAGAWNGGYTYRVIRNKDLMYIYSHNERSVYMYEV